MAAAISYLSEFHCNANRTKYVTIAAMFMTLSVAYQGVMGLFIMPIDWEVTLFGGMMVYRPWRFFILLSSALSAVACVVLVFLPESPKFLLAMGKPDEALETLKMVYSWNTGKPKNVTYIFE